MAGGGDTGPELSHLEENSHFLLVERRFFEILVKYKEKESYRKVIHQQLKAEKLRLALFCENKALRDKITLLEEKRAQDKTKGSPIAPSWRQYEHQLKNLLHDGSLGAPDNRGKKRSSSDSLTEEKGQVHSRKKMHVVSPPAHGANKKQTSSEGSEEEMGSDSNNSNLVVRKTVNRKKNKPLKKTKTVGNEDKVVKQNSAAMDDSSLLGAVGLIVPAPSTANSSHLNPNQLSPLPQDGGVVDNSNSGSTEVNASTSSVEVAIVTLPNNSMTAHEPQEHPTTFSGEKKSADSTLPKKKVATSKTAESTLPKKKVDISKTAEGTLPKKKVDISKTAESTQPKKKVATSKTAEGTLPKKKVATSKTAEGTLPKKKVATSKTAEGTLPKKKVATTKTAEGTLPKKKVDISKLAGNAVKSNQTKTLDKEKKRGRPKKVTTPPPPLPVTNNQKSKRGWPKGKPRKQKVTTTDPLTVSPAVSLPVSSQIAQPPFSVMPTESIPMETQVVAVQDVGSTEDFRPGSSQDSHDDVIVTLSAQLESSPIHMEKADSESSLDTAKKVDSEFTSRHVTEQVDSELDLVKSVNVSKDSDSDTGQPRDPKSRVLPFSLARKEPARHTGTLPVKHKTHEDESEDSPPSPKQPLYETTMLLNKTEGVNKKGRKFNKSKSGTSFLPVHSLSVGNQSELFHPLLHPKAYKPPRLKQKVDTSNI